LKKLYIAAAALLFGTMPVIAPITLFADETSETSGTSAGTGAAILAHEAFPGTGGTQDVRKNRFYRESIRLNELARQFYDDGDYDKSAEYAEEAMKYAQLSDEYVAAQLKIKKAVDTIASAKARLDWAEAEKAPVRYPEEYGQAQTYRETAENEYSAENWDGATSAAERVLEALSSVEAAPRLPGQYMVGEWLDTKDCLWNIAAMPWAYNDPFKWRVLYEANKSILPRPNRPNIITPGLVLTIPSIKGEIREGLWREGEIYPDF
jgi:nucleoid-associated protein YgaU